MSTVPEENYEEPGTALEQTIYALANAYSDLGIYTLSQRQIEGIANALYLSDEKLASALVRMDKPLTEERSKQSQLFGMLVRCYFILSEYESLNTEECQQVLRKNIEIYENLCVHFEQLNAESAIYERIYGQSDESMESVFGKLDFHINDFMPILKDLAWCDHFWVNYSHLLPVIYTILNYAFISHAKTLFLVVAIQIIKHSSLFAPAMRKIAEAFYNEMTFILHSARVISIQFNSLFQAATGNFDDRVKNNSNTTRLQILYGYNNYDIYELRIDMAHQGVGWTHFNMKSPGGIKSFLFTKDEYTEAIGRYPQMEKCFIQYGERWALKEKINCAMTIDENAIFDELVEKKEHQQLFKDEFSEELLLQFLQIIARILPDRYSVPIDKDGEYTRYCFSIDHLIKEASDYYCELLRDDVCAQEEAMVRILARAVANHWINQDDIKDFYTSEEICTILEIALSQFDY